MSPLTTRRDCGGGILTRLHTGRNVGWYCGTGYVVKVNGGIGVTSPISGGRSVGIVRSQTQAMEFSLV
jgi:hypothetical protein